MQFLFILYNGTRFARWVCPMGLPNGIGQTRWAHLRQARPSRARLRQPLAFQMNSDHPITFQTNHCGRVGKFRCGKGTQDLTLASEILFVDPPTCKAEIISGSRYFKKEAVGGNGSWPARGLAWAWLGWVCSMGLPNAIGQPHWANPLGKPLSAL